MTILSAAQSAGIRLLARKPASLFSAADTFGLELGELATEAATDIAEYYDWQKLKVLQSHAGDAFSIGFPLAPDYGRMLTDGEVHSTMWQNRPFRKAKDENDWIRQQAFAPTGSPGVWIILGGQMQIFPPMPIGEAATYYYISNNIVADNSGLFATTGGNVLADAAGNIFVDSNGKMLTDGAAFLGKTAFTDDNDVFVLPERLLTLSLIWRWRAQKRMEYSEDLTNYETALETAVGTDKGARILVAGKRRRRRDLGSDNVYPGRING